MFKAEDSLFKDGLTVDNYYIERTPFSEVICFEYKGRHYNLLVGDDAHWRAMMDVLLQRGVKIVTKGLMPRENRADM